MNTKRYYLRIAAILFAGLIVAAIAYIGWVEWNRYLLAVYGDEPPLTFLEAIKPVPKFRIFEGFDRFIIVPEGQGRDEEEQMFQKIAEAKKNAMQLCEHPFYPEPFELSEADAKTFLQLVHKRGTYAEHKKPGGYEPECGGFNPDAIAEWEVNGRHYQLLICLGCGELRTNIEGDGYHRHYISDQNREAFRDVLYHYFKHHHQDIKKRW